MFKKYFLILFLAFSPYLIFSKTLEVNDNLQTLVSSICDQFDDDESIENIAGTIFDTYTSDHMELIQEVVRLYEKGYSTTKITSILTQARIENSYSDNKKNLYWSSSFLIKLTIATGTCIGLYYLYWYFTQPTNENNAQQQGFIQNQQGMAHDQTAIAELHEVIANNPEQQMHENQQSVQEQHHNQHAQPLHNIEPVNQNSQAALELIAAEREAIRQRHLEELARHEELHRSVENFDQRIRDIGQQIQNDREQSNARIQELQSLRQNRATNDIAAIYDTIAVINERRQYLQRLVQMEEQQQALRNERTAYLQQHGRR